MFELSGVNYEEVLEQGDSILVRVIASSSYRGFELSGLYCMSKLGHLKHAEDRFRNLSVTDDYTIEERDSRSGLTRLNP